MDEPDPDRPAAEPGAARAVPHLLTASELAESCSRFVVDIRPEDERRGEMGFIPASYSLPFDTQGHLEDYAVRLRQANIAREPTVLVCLTGKRSLAALESLASVYTLPLAHLEGGVLAWRAAKQPLCRPIRPTPRSAQASDRVPFFHKLRACFVAEMIETSLNRADDLDTDPVSLMQRCFELERVELDEDDPRALARVIDRLALQSRRQGATLRRVARNVNRMLAELEG